MAEISKAEFLDWKKSVVTEFVLKELDERIVIYTDMMRMNIVDGNIAKAARYEGMIEGVELLAEIAYEEIADES